MSDETKPSLPGALWQLANLVFKREAIMLVAAMALLVGAGGATVVYGQGYLDGGAAKIVAPVAEAVKVQTERLDEHLKIAPGSDGNAYAPNAHAHELLGIGVERQALVIGLASGALPFEMDDQLDVHLGAHRGLTENGLDVQQAQPSHFE